MRLNELADRLLRKIRARTNGDRKPLSQEEKWETIDHVRKTYQVTAFVESGTFLGDTVNYFKDKFEQVYSIELQRDLHEAAQRRFSASRNISLIYGDSGKMMEEVLCQLSGPALFWLDGHYSTEFWVGDKFIRTARGEKNTPIEDELESILTKGVEHVILIDDARFFGIAKDYPSLGRIRKVVRRHKPSYGVRLIGDIIAILPGREL
jgi:hypothetical protein